MSATPIRWEFKGSNETFILMGPWLVGPIGGGIYPNGPKTRYFILTGQCAKKTFLDKNTPIKYNFYLILKKQKQFLFFSAQMTKISYSTIDPSCVARMGHIISYVPNIMRLGGKLGTEIE